MPQHYFSPSVWAGVTDNNTMKKLLLVGLAVMASITAVNAGWIRNPANNHWYRAVFTGEVWQDADDEALYTYGGYLLHVDDQAEANWILATYRTPASRQGNAWLWCDTPPYDVVKFSSGFSNATSFKLDTICATCWQRPYIVERETSPF